jgi:hypothetical protein
MVTSFSGGRSWSTQREPPTMGKQLLKGVILKCPILLQICSVLSLCLFSVVLCSPYRLWYVLTICLVDGTCLTHEYHFATRNRIDCKQSFPSICFVGEQQHERFVSLYINFLLIFGFNATFSNISAISWWPVLVVDEAGVPRENHRPWAYYLGPKKLRGPGWLNELGSWIT